MQSKESLYLKLEQNPDDFVTLHDLAVLFQEERNFPACFAMVERAISSYDNAPNDSLQEHYFDAKRLHAHLLRNRLPLILGEVYNLMDPRWTPVFKLGRPREMAWNVTPKNIDSIIPSLASPLLKKLRYLNIEVQGCIDAFFERMAQVPFAMLRLISIQSEDAPSERALCAMFRKQRESCAALTGLSLRFPIINDAMALTAFQSLQKPDTLAFTSMDRSHISHELCEAMADDPRSNAISRLSLVGTSIGNEGLFAIFSSNNFRNLQALDLHDGILNNGACKVITSATDNNLKVRTIDMRYNLIDPAGLHMLKNTKIQCLTDHQHERPAGR